MSVLATTACFSHPIILKTAWHWQPLFDSEESKEQSYWLSCHNPVTDYAVTLINQCLETL